MLQTNLTPVSNFLNIKISVCLTFVSSLLKRKNVFTMSFPSSKRVDKKMKNIERGMKKRLKLFICYKLHQLLLLYEQFSR